MTCSAHNFGKWSIIVLAGSLLALSPAAASEPADVDTNLQYEIEATYLYKFVPFVEWPSNAFATQESPIVLCVADRGPLDRVIDSAVAGRGTGSRPIVVRHVDRNDDLRACNVLFDSVPDNQTFAQVRSLPVLTVSDSDEGSAHGIITFVVVAHHVRFDIDEDEASQHGLRISSKLLELAHDVTGKGKATR